MECLWVTLADPEPATNGQLIYSKGLIEATQRAGASLTVIGVARPDHRRPMLDPSGIEWRLALTRPRPAWLRLLSRDPVLAQHTSPAMKQILEHSLAERLWDVVVFDSICAAWSLQCVLRHRARSPRPPRIVYIAHNHEVTVAQRMVAEARGARRWLRRIDALKVTNLEARLISAADVVTSNTPQDCQRFNIDSGGRTIVLLPPGYGGPRITERVIDAAVPRRAVLVGSYDFPPKRVALESFLEAAATRLSNAEIELQIVGGAAAGYLDGLRRRYPSVEFVGPVADVQPYPMRARLALVPDLLGGFKLKGLDYVFHRLPILAMRVALPGMPLEDGHSVELFDSHTAMAEGIVRLIDDFPGLNARQERAYAACADRFDWDRIGRHLVAEMRGVDRPVRAVTGGLPSKALPRMPGVAAGG